MKNIFAVWFLIATTISAQTDLWDLPPTQYSDREPHNRLVTLAQSWQKNFPDLDGKSDLARLQYVLQALGISEESQILVFSKTSKQNQLIRPEKPRALFFSMDCYVGYVPGGMIEIIIHDAQLGPVFYLIPANSHPKSLSIERDTSDCLSCHGTGRTENVPGMLIRSVFPDAEGHPILSQGSELVMHDTPILQRWGGYYVTGSIALPHLGNQTYDAQQKPKAQWSHLKDLNGIVSTTCYPRSTSDIVALLALEHQCHAHNLLTAAKMNYERAYFLSRAIAPNQNPDLSSAGRVAEQAAQRIVEWFLFHEEASLGDEGVEGNEAFQSAFAATIPKAASGDSLSDFQLHHRLFKNRCYYMIYSEAFRSLPHSVKQRVLMRLRKIMENDRADDAFPSIKASERRRIREILRDTGVW